MNARLSSKEQDTFSLYYLSKDYLPAIPSLIIKSTYTTNKLFRQTSANMHTNNECNRITPLHSLHSKHKLERSLVFVYLIHSFIH